MSEKHNIEIVHSICVLLEELRRCVEGGSYQTQITFVKVRFGHDRLYVIDSCKFKRELDWRHVETFETGILKTVQRYLGNLECLANFQCRVYY